MLINATQPEEVRVALVDGQWLYDLDIENCLKDQKKSNIYKGKITRIEPSLEAAFVDYGEERHGFLPLKEISRDYFSKQPRDIEGRVKIKDVLSEGQEVIVQIDKEERGNKGAALTTFVSLAGRYLVLMPNNPRAGGISRRIDGNERAELKDALSCIDLPKGMGVIVRTAGVGRNAEELQGDLANLINLWSTISTAATEVKAPEFLFKESNAIIRAIRDYLRTDIGEVIVDKQEAFDLASTYIQQNMPNYRSKVKLYEDPIPLFNRYQIEGQIETAFEREVKLPSGGAIVIDVTEALISIDINSSRATKGSDIEETALQTNLEAADEIARQLRLRDMGGLVVIDFIDMQAARNQREVESRMKEALAMDRARVQIGRISPFGLLEMSRQRLRPSLGETTSKVCPRCSGQGTIRGTKSIALSILRLVEEEAQKERSAEIRAICPVSVATYLLNEKRKAISDIESRQSTRIVILPSEEMTTPHFEVQRLRNDEIEKVEISYKIEKPTEDSTNDALTDEQKIANMPKPVVQPGMIPKSAATPAASATAEPSLLAKLIKGITDFFKAEPEQKEIKPKRHNRQNNRNGRNQNRRRGSSDRKHRERDQAISDNLQHKSTNNTATHDDKTSSERPNNNEGRRNNGRNRRRRNNNDHNANTDNNNATNNADNSQNTPQNENKPARRPNNRQGRNQQRRKGPRPEQESLAVETTDVQNVETENTPKVKEAKAPKAKAPKTPKAKNKETTKETSKETPKKAVKAKDTHKEVSQETPKETENKHNDEKLNQQVISAIETAEHMKAVASNATNANELSTAQALQNAQAATVTTTATEAEAVEAVTTETSQTAEETSQVTAPQKAPKRAPKQKAPKEETTAKEQTQARPVSEAVSEAEAEAKAVSEAEAPTSKTDSKTEASVEKVATEAVAEKAQEAPAKAAKKKTPAAAKKKQPKVEKTTPEYSRAQNDPRVNSKPVISLEITNVPFSVLMSAPLDTSLAADIERNPRPLARAANDPRNDRSTNIQVGE